MSRDTAKALVEPVTAPDDEERAFAAEIDAPPAPAGKPASDEAKQTAPAQNKAPETPAPQASGAATPETPAPQASDAATPETPAPELFADFDESDESDYDPALAHALNSVKREIATLRDGSRTLSKPLRDEISAMVSDAVKTALAEAKSPPPAPAPDTRTVLARPGAPALPGGATPGALPDDASEEAAFAAEIDRKHFR